tara:strand:- start:353 stop:565 length:213 start_codon:yes stop_codon:yes gene_type:complete
MSMPNAPSVKYMGSIYPTEEECLYAQASYLNMYEAKPQEYKDQLVTDTSCLSFNAFPVKGMNYKDSSFDT